MPRNYLFVYIKYISMLHNQNLWFFLGMLVEDEFGSVSKALKERR